jgi:hypothetical protein
VVKAADAFHTKTTRPNEMWQTAAHKIKDRLDNAPHRPSAWSPDRRWRRQIRRQQRPFRIGQINWQSQSRAGMMRARGISPHR